MILNRREKILLGTLALVGCGYLLDYFWLHPLNERSSQLGANSLSLQAELEQKESMTGRYGGVDKQEKIIADYAAVRAQVPVQPMITDVIEFIEAVAHETGVVAHSVRYDDREEPGQKAAALDNKPLREIGFIIHARGSRSGLLGFLDRIENAPRLFTVTETRIVTVKDTTAMSNRAGDGSRPPPVPPEASMLSDMNMGEPDLYELEMEITAYYYK
ncbi:MAG: hypothetical protein ABRQ24_11245 [Syntrophomonadaceae bacterium]